MAEKEVRNPYMKMKRDYSDLAKRLFPEPFGVSNMKGKSMTDNEAIKILENHELYLRNCWKPYPDEKVLQAINMALKALEKQLPKKFIIKQRRMPSLTFNSKYNRMVDFVACPICNADLSYISYNYCPWCGQKIDYKTDTYIFMGEHLVEKEEKQDDDR